MSRRSIQFLQNCGLLNKKGKIGNIQKCNNNDLAKRLTEYYEFKKDIFQDEINQYRSNDMLSCLLSSFSTKSTVESTIDSSLVFQKVFMDDPLFGLVRANNEFVRNMEDFVGVKQEFDRNAFFIALHFYQSLFPLLQHGDIAFLPLQHLHSHAVRGIRYSPEKFRPYVPENLYPFFTENALVEESFSGENGERYILAKPIEKPCRAISIRFKNDESGQAMMYLLHQAKVIDEGNNQQTVSIIPTSIDTPLDMDSFNSWVKQSIQSTAFERLYRISVETSIAEKIGAAYLTESTFESHLCGRDKSQTVAFSEDETSAVNFIHANRPQIKLSSARELLKLKSKNEKLFSRFHDNLLGISRKLSRESNKADFHRAAKELMRSEVIPHVNSIESAYSNLTGTMLGNAVKGIGTIGIALLTSTENIPVASFLGYKGLEFLGETLAPIKLYLHEKRTNPAFIWKTLIK